MTVITIARSFQTGKIRPTMPMMPRRRGRNLKTLLFCFVFLFSLSNLWSALSIRNGGSIKDEASFIEAVNRDLCDSHSVFEMPNEQQQEALTCRFNVSIYVYEDLPHNYTTVLEETIERTRRWSKENVATEYALVKLFRTNPCRTYDPHNATHFFVPYMHFSHCNIQKGHGLGCSQVPDSYMKELFDSLRYYNDTTKSQHIFVHVYDSIMSKKQMNQRSHWKLTSGPINSRYDGPGSIVVPIMHTDSRYQPSCMKYDEAWWTRSRNYSFVSFYGGLNPRMRRHQPRRFRKYFWKGLNYSTSGTLGGKPYISLVLDTNTSVTPEIDYRAFYRESIICPILPGDNAWQARFFDVIRSGCLPLVLEWPKRNGKRSWWIPDKHFSISKTYPFFHGDGGESNDTMHDLEIDYDSFVIRAPANTSDETNMSPIFEAMRAILADPGEIARRQRNMMVYTPLLTYGMGKDAHVHNDAFAAIMKRLER